MTMNVHMLAALDDLFQRWQDRLAALTEEQLTTPLSPSELSIKDNLAHVWAWQQRSVAKVVAALEGHDPRYPVWPVVEGDPDEDDKTDVANAWIFQHYHAMPWREVFEGWRANFRRFLDLAFRDGKDLRNGFDQQADGLRADGCNDHNIAGIVRCRTKAETR